MSERFEHNPRQFVGVAAPSLVYVGMAKREDFDRIAAPLIDHGEDEKGHVLVKSVGNFDPVTVVFQYWLKSLTNEAMLEDYERKKREKSSPAEEA